MIAHGRGRVTGNARVIGLVLTLIAGCAGSDTPPRDAELEANLEAAYEAGQGGAVGAAGAANAPVGGAAGSGMANTGGAAGAGPGVGAGGAGGAGGSGNAVAGDYCNAPETILIPTCGGSGCHEADAPIGEFGVSVAEAEASLDRASVRGPACGLYIDSANIEDSLILTKITDEFDRANCGALVMPLGLPTLDADELECLEDWLSQFAD
jgi:hypothetical protein